MQIPVKDVYKHMTIVDGKDTVLVTETWPNQGNGLGIVLKGKTQPQESLYFRRFLDPDMTVELVQE